MAKRNKKSVEKSRGERERLRKKREREQELLELEMELEKEAMEDDFYLSTEEQPDDEEESLEKEYYADAAVIAPSGPTSFEELDAMRDAEEKAAKVRRVTYDVQDLVWNILHDHEMIPTEKADRMMDVADGFSDRVNAVVMSDDMQKDMDVLQIEAILGTYERTASLIEKGSDWVEDHITKRQLTGTARKRLQESDFALPGKRKYPIHDKAHVRNALARAAQQIQKGGEAAADAKQALPKIRAAAKAFGIEAGLEKSAILIEKDLDGNWRWVGRPSNNFIDLQEDIISAAAHKEYVGFLNMNKEMAPQFFTWHLPGTARENAADGWMEHEGTLIMSGKLTEPEAAALLKAQAQFDLGMSVGGVAFRGNPNDKREITSYRLYEVSDLPRNRAANPFTSLETMITKEVSMNDQEKIKYLSMYMGSDEEKAKAFLEKTGQTQKQLQEAGLTSKEKEADDVQEPAAEKKEPVTAPSETPDLDVEALTKQIIAKVGDEFDINGLNAFAAKTQDSMEKVQLLEDLVKELTGNREDELAEMINPPAGRFAWSIEKRKSTSDDNLLKKDDKEDQELLKAGPQASDWLSNLTHTVPVSE